MEEKNYCTDQCNWINCTIRFFFLTLSTHPLWISLYNKQEKATTFIPLFPLSSSDQIHYSQNYFSS